MFGLNGKVFAFGFFPPDLATSSLGSHENLRQTFSRTDLTLG